jgi:CBS domain-containing protein
MRIDILRPVISARLAVIATDATLRTAAAAFCAPHVGLLVVCDENTKVAGVVSKSDIVRHVARAEEARAAPIATLMSRNVVSCGPDDDLYVTWKRMRAQSLQNMPVLGTDARPLGVLDIRDALKALYEQEEYQERLLSNYVGGVGYQ